MRTKTLSILLSLFLGVGGYAQNTQDKAGGVPPVSQAQVSQAQVSKAKAQVYVPCGQTADCRNVECWVQDISCWLRQTKFRVGTNLLYLAGAGAPNLSVEWQTSKYFGFLVHGIRNHLMWKDKYGNYRTWVVQPEIRWYIPSATYPGWFLGVEGHFAHYNIKFGKHGYQGRFNGCGLTAGYKLQASSHFDIDFSIGYGYTHLKYNVYYRDKGVMVHDQLEPEKRDVRNSLVTPTQLAVTLVWKLN